MKVHFIVTQSFLRTAAKTDPFYDPIIRVLEGRSDIDWKVFIWDKGAECGYPSEKVGDYRSFEWVGVWFYRFCRLFAWRLPAWKIYRFIGALVRPMFAGKFLADVVITQSGQFADVFSGLLPNTRIVDIQHGVIYSKHRGYFDESGRLLPIYQVCINREFWLYGRGYADCFFKHPDNVKDLQGRVKVVGDVIRAGDGSSKGVKERWSDGIMGFGSRRVRDVVVFSLQLTPDSDREELEASVKRIEEFFEFFFKKFGDRYECRVKHHPRFGNVYDMSGFFAKFPKLKETKVQWSELYPRMALHVTFTSTVTFDCASAGVPTYLLDFPAAKILHREFWRDDYAYPYFDKTAEEILAIPADEARKTMVEWYGKFYAPFDRENCLQLLKSKVDNKMI